MTTTGNDTLGTRSTLSVGGKNYAYYSLDKAAAKLGDVSRLPFSMKVLLENLLRFEDGGFTVSTDDVQALVDWQKDPHSNREIQYRPARVLLQDFTGVPCVVDLAAMRDAIATLGGDTSKINPLVPVHLVIDHSVMVDAFGTPQSFEENVALEYQRNMERYEFLKWGQGAFDNFEVVPPGTGICHQVNLEYLAQTVWTKDEDGETIAYPDTLVGTDSHTTMVNGMAVLGWGVGGIEAEAAMLGQPITMLIPEVVGFKMTGKINEGITATDLVLTVTEMLRKRGVVGKFVEFYGPGLDYLSLEDQATIANMAPEYGATCGFFPVDRDTLDYLRTSGRSPDRVALVEGYSRAQDMFRETDTPDPVFTDTLELDLSTVVSSLSGPKRPQDRVSLPDVARKFEEALPNHPEAQLALNWIGQLYAIDERAGPDLPKRAELRKTEAPPVLAELKTWLWSQAVLKTLSIGKAAAYVIANWDRLTLFASDPLIPLDNNGTERGIRGPVVGRKNHYGSRSRSGTVVAATLYTLIETAKLHHVKPTQYLLEAVRAADRGEVLFPWQLVAEPVEAASVAEHT